MSSSEQHTEREAYRVALVFPNSQRLLTEPHGSSLSLPCVEIRRWTRPAEQLTQAIRQRWNLASVVIDFLPSPNDLLPCAVLEVFGQSEPQAPYGLAAVELHETGEDNLTRDECRIIRDMLRHNTNGRGPFSRFGWVSEAQAWIQESVRDHEVKFTSDIRQLNASATFALVRFGTKGGPAYWLKATGEPNKHESTVTATLSRLFPEYLPLLVAVRPDWNAWVSEEAGQPIRDQQTLAVMEAAILSLADLQKKSIAHRDELMAAGCLDRSLPVLKAHLDEITDYLEDAMSRQVSTKAPRLDGWRLRELESIVRNDCDRMQDLGIPDTLVHNDINAGNILTDGARCIFTDWAEAYLGNPFLTVQHLCAQAARGGDKTATWVARMKDLYRIAWREWLNDTQIDVAFSLMPVLAIASYLYGRGDWLTSPRRQQEHFEAYMRSLARHIDRAAQTSALQEALCR